MIKAWIGLGANLGDRAAAFDAALERIDHLPESRLEAVSHYYLSPPWGEPDQPQFLNAVAGLYTKLPAAALLGALLEIETALGRRRTGRRWGPRLIDLDLLLYGDQQIDRPGLRVPHPRIAQRAFVLVPLLELAPGLIIPGQGRADALLAALDDAERSAIKRGPVSAYRPSRIERKETCR